MGKCHRKGSKPRKHRATFASDRLPFALFVRDIAKSIQPDVRFQATALLVLQQCTEAYLVDILQEAHICATYDKKPCVRPKHMQLAFRMMGKPTFRQS
jgi:histone H3